MFAGKPILLLCLLFMTAVVLTAAPLEAYIDALTPEQKSTLLEKNELVVYSEGAPAFKLMPPLIISEQIRREFDGMKANVNDEAFFILPKPDTDNLLLYIHNKLRNVSSLSGIQYHSNHYRQWKTLFDNVFLVKNAEDETPIEETGVTERPSEERILMHLEDVNFGPVYYEAVYFNSENETSFGWKNVTSLKYKGIPVISDQNARFQMVIIPTDENLLVYGICGVKAGSLVRKMIHIPSSFFTRMRALRDWFKQQIYE